MHVYMETWGRGGVHRKQSLTKQNTRTCHSTDSSYKVMIHRGFYIKCIFNFFFYNSFEVLRLVRTMTVAHTSYPFAHPQQKRDPDFYVVVPDDDFWRGSELQLASIT